MYYSIKSACSVLATCHSSFFIIMKKKDWFRIKNYPHIGLPIQLSDKIKTIKYIKNKDKIAKHAFFPFIHKNIITRKFRRIKHADGTRSKLREVDEKTRPIHYANSIDSNIYSYYASKIQEKYEEKLKEEKLENVPTAYRRIPLNPAKKKGRNKNNIDFANEVFNYIRESEEHKLIGITFDIDSFFPNLDHEILKKAWIKVMGFNKTLCPDHYNVFRNITKFSYVEEFDIFKEFQKNIYTKSKSGKVTKKSIDKIKHLKSNNAIAFCQKKDIKILRSKGYIKNNKYDFIDANNKKLRLKGIPQGSPISAVLANIYLLDFDKSINSFIKNLGGLYRRYSDDIVIIAKKKYEKKILEHVTSEIKNYKLLIQPKKTQIFWFIKCAGRYFCFERNQNTKNRHLQTNTSFDYLGFSFDGKYTTLKSASLAGYYRKMKRTIKRGYFYTFHNNTSTRGKLFKTRLYKRFTHLGAKRRLIYKRVPNTTNQWEKSHRYDWGNYLSYAKMAARVMDSNKIKSQIKNHWKKFHTLMSS